MPNVITVDTTVRSREGAAAAGGYTTSPYGVAGAVLWLKADAEAFQNFDFTFPVVTGGNPVGSWKDQTGLGHGVVAPGVSQKPGWVIAQQNGLPIVRFDAVDDYLKALFTLNGPYHVFMVVRPRAWSNNAVMIGGGVADKFSITQNTASPNLGVWNGTGNVTNIPGITLNTFAILQCLMAGSNAHLKLNAGTNTVLGGVDVAGGITIGAHNNPSNYSAIDVGEVIVYGVALSNADETTVRTALNTRWAIF